MGKRILSNVMAALDGAGFSVARGYPAGAMPAITGPVCAVNLQKADLRAQTATALVTVLSPESLGAAACEDAALEAAAVLAELGGKCAVARCALDGRMGLYSAKVTAQFYTSTPMVSLEGEQLAYVTAFSCWRTVEDDVPELDDAAWNFRLEEFFPVGTEDDPGPEEPFFLIHTSANGTLTFTGCVWTYQRRVWSADGVRQIRLGMAEDMQTG